jgi:hypothetical protein
MCLFLWWCMRIGFSIMSLSCFMLAALSVAMHCYAQCAILQSLQDSCTFSPSVVLVLVGPSPVGSMYNSVPCGACSSSCGIALAAPSATRSWSGVFLGMNRPTPTTWREAGSPSLVGAPGCGGRLTAVVSTQLIPVAVLPGHCHSSVK